MQPQSLAVLTELALTARDNAAVRCAQSQKLAQQARAQLELLRNYARDYQRRAQTGLAKGSDMAAQLNWRRFAARLEQAIEAQAAEVGAREQQVALAEAELQQAQRKLKSLQTLAERKQAAAQQVAQRKDQKLTDEMARQSARPLTDAPW